jgi:hypothetical protein
MTLAAIKPGDIVRVVRNGEPQFYAFVSEIGPTDLVKKGELKALTLNGQRPRIVTARQVTGHWRLRKARAA